MGYNKYFVQPSVDGDLSFTFVAYAKELANEAKLGDIVEIFVSQSYSSIIVKFMETFNYTITPVGWLKDDSWLIQFEHGLFVSGIF